MNNKIIRISEKAHLRSDFRKKKYFLGWGSNHTHYTLKQESLVGTLEVRQMNGVPQSGADRSATAESRVRTYWSNRFTVL